MPNASLLSFLKQSFTNRKLPGFKNFESLAFDTYVSKKLYLAAVVMTDILTHFKKKKKPQ